ncbi:Protein-glutamate methylesterase/protein-glutamine glutaminase [Desulfonema magnum]|uniref:Protein-glutamate methylesterase/protein-glutamine glutaminase n=1 Tax=Desulfonema magnum TaxID=45655 RepID=A0A975GP36_9BACT|nr:Protein-glutamate methylesterase/protein-glutamine glutaminase [Desulfonema magnum]
MEKDLKILVVDDTVTYRQILSKIVSGFENVELLGVASNGKIALSKIKLKNPDLVLLDVFMPEMDGLETLDQIKKEHPHIDVIMLSGMDRENANLTVKALAAGALDFIPKPRGTSVDDNIAELRTALSRLILMARTRKYSRQARGISGNNTPATPLSAPEKRIVKSAAPKKILLPETDTENLITPPSENRYSRKPERIDVVVMGVSTGGPNALQEMIPKLDGDFPVPILAVQHMPSMFTASLAARLDKASSIKVVEGEDGQLVKKGIIYIAPGGRHMIVKKDRFNNTVLGLTDALPVNSCRPSVDVLFHSVAKVYGGNVLAIILTGMGTDGVSGVAAIRRRGGYSIVQDEKTSVIWGMPGAVVEANEANEIIPLDRMASRIAGITKKRRF